MISLIVLPSTLTLSEPCEPRSLIAPPPLIVKLLSASFDVTVMSNL